MTLYIGMNNTSGKAITDIDHLRQSVRDILLTPQGYLSGQLPALSRLGVLCGSLGRGLDRKRQTSGGEGCFLYSSA